MFAAAWALILVGIAALGLSTQQPALDSVAAATLGAAQRTTATRTNDPAAAARIGPTAIILDQSLGDDGLMGGLTFGDNVRTQGGPP